jgi:glycosyltransferase involved in cell wall biosynthesis
MQNPAALPRAADPDLTSIIVPAFNEAATIEAVLRRLAALPFAKEVIVIDDGSSDETASVAEAAARELSCVRVHRSPINLGKGGAVRIGWRLARGGVLAIQDADLELDPNDLVLIVARFQDPAVRAVYGSRFARPGFRCTRLQRLANGFLTLLTNVLFGSRLSDMETCYKVFRREVLARVSVRALRFDIEPEVTAKVLKLGIPITEVPISYTARTASAGKKIGALDGVAACWTLLRMRVTS